MQINTIEKNGLWYGILTAIGLILFFSLMKVIGLIEHYELRMLNILFLFAGEYLAIKKYLATEVHANYLGGIAVGLLTSGVALMIFSAFVVIYLEVLNPDFMESLRQHEKFGQYLNPYISGVVIFLEGTISGLLLSFTMMQYFKHSHLTNAEQAVP